MELNATVIADVTQMSEPLTTAEVVEGESSHYYVSDEVKDYFSVVLGIIIESILSLFGVIGNILNMVVFAKLGLKDSMSVGIFALSLSDLFVTGLQFCMSACKAVGFLYPDSIIDPWSLGFFVFGWAKSIAYLISCWLTAMISAERCICVVFPFKVKQVFTKSRSVAMVIFIYVANISLHIPIYVPKRMGWQAQTSFRVEGNVTVETSRQIMTAIFTEETGRLEELVDLVGSIILSTVAQVIIIVCAIWMMSSLKASSKVRVSGTKEESSDPSKSVVATSESYLSPKEKRLVKVVLFLAILMTSCNIPRFTVLAVYHILGLNEGVHHNFTSLIWDIAEIFGTISSSTNIVAYLMLNSNYRKIVAQCCKFQDKIV